MAAVARLLEQEHRRTCEDLVPSHRLGVGVEGASSPRDIMVSDLGLGSDLPLINILNSISDSTQASVVHTIVLTTLRVGQSSLVDKSA